MRKNIKRSITIILTIMAVVVSPLSAYAAPKTMPDGQIFDAEFYAETYLDVKQALGTDETVLYNHYLTYGKAEGRKPYADAQTSAQPAATWQVPATAIEQLNDYNTDKSWLVDRKEGDGRYWYAPITFRLSEEELSGKKQVTITEAIGVMRQLFPTGKVFDENHWYHWLGKTKKDGLNRNYAACGGFALMLQDAIYGNAPATIITGKGTPICLYDIIMLDPAANNSTGHYAFVIGINPKDNTVTVAEANVHVQNPDGSISAGMIYWDRTYNAKDIMGVIHRG